MVKMRFPRTGFALVLALQVLSGSALAHEHPANTPMARHWQERLAAVKGTAVSVTADEQGRLWSVSMRQGHLWLARSDDQGKSFAELGKINQQPEAILADGQSRPLIAAHGQVVVVSWAQALPKLHTGHVRLARSEDGGKSFAEPVVVNQNREEIGHGFNAMKMDRQGNLVLAWLDGRERSAAMRKGAKYAGSSVYYSLSRDYGRTFSADAKLADHSCECCRIGLALTPEGEAVALWRHVFGDNIRDFALATLQRGVSVVRASEDNWQVSACPHHGGDLAVDAGGRRHLVWFTGSQKAPGLFYRHADGTQFGKVMAFGNLDAQAGHPTVFAQGTTVFLAWREYEAGRYRVMSMYSRDRGEHWSAVSEVASAEGAADLPLFVSGANAPLLAWGQGEGLKIINLEAH